jgi:hypothetical protein
MTVQTAVGSAGCVVAGVADSWTGGPSSLTSRVSARSDSAAVRRLGR